MRATRLLLTEYNQDYPSVPNYASPGMRRDALANSSAVLRRESLDSMVSFNLIKRLLLYVSTENGEGQIDLESQHTEQSNLMPNFAAVSDPAIACSLRHQVQFCAMKPSPKRQFVVRELRGESELAFCAKLDHSYETDIVWQMDVRHDTDDMLVRFRTIRLPRTIRAPYPRDPATLLKSWSRRDCFLVAAVDDIVLGYVNMRVDALAQGWLTDLVVGAAVRRRRIGSALLEQATRWAKLHGLHTLTAETQTKNFPGINFAQANGFSFCGFNDHYYANQDIALFFSKRL